VDYCPSSVCDKNCDPWKNGTASEFARDVASMTRARTKFLVGIILTLVIGCESAGAQKNAGPQGPEQGVIRRQTWLVPAQDRYTLMWTEVFRPQGNGPFPLAVINHGSTQNELQRGALGKPEYAVLTEWLVARGYAVAVPQRPGHGRTGGPYYEDQGGCANADYRKSGMNAAAAIMAAIDYMRVQKFIQKTGVVALGQSAGGWGTVALASQPLPSLKAVVAFSAGRGGRIDGVAGSNCAPQRLLDAAHQFGEKSHAPTLWLYAANDSYFPPELSRKIVEAYRMGGGHAEYQILPAVGADGHEFIQDRSAVALWGPLVEKFLKR
jgi:dienelactone hydrolase